MKLNELTQDNKQKLANLESYDEKILGSVMIDFTAIEKTKWFVHESSNNHFNLLQLDVPLNKAFQILIITNKAVEGIQNHAILKGDTVKNWIQSQINNRELDLENNTYNSMVLKMKEREEIE